MGQHCSTAACSHVEPDEVELSRTDSPDPVMYDLMRKSIQATTTLAMQQNNAITHNSNSSSNNHHHANNKRKPPGGQQHLLYKNAPKAATTNNTHSSTLLSNATSSSQNKNRSNAGGAWLPAETPVMCPTRLLIRRQSLRVVEEGGGTHIYAIRYPEDTPDKVISEQATPQTQILRQEQCPPKKPAKPQQASSSALPSMPVMEGSEVFTSAAMASIPRQSVLDWVTVSEEHNIYIADAGLTALQCDHIITMTEQVCRGQYAAYTYAKQTLGCREYPELAQTSFLPVHTVVHAIIRKFCTNTSTTNSSSKPKGGSSSSSEQQQREQEQQQQRDQQRPARPLQLDDREPHIVKYDVTKKERQKLDMHTDKSEWTFLIALSNGCGVDYEGGGTYFECLDATVHIQRGHALIFPGKLRHCGQKITSGLRFLLVGFLVDKGSTTITGTSTITTTTANANADATSTTNSGSTAAPSPPGVAPLRP